jgi:UDP-N-acetylglucosamine 4,6-dehydratase (inverting)
MLNKNYFKNKSILITGGTGSFGQKFVDILLKNFKNLKKIVVFSRDELKQFEMQKKYKDSDISKMRFFIGDLRDKDRISRALDGIDIVIHAAALKQVPTAEYNPFEFIKTNILGAQNLIDASLDSNVQNVIALSTDKAVTPINLYGATKLCSDKLFLTANNIKGNRKIKFSIVRYGNVMGSRGSVVPFFLKHKSKGYLPITHPKMTRFNLSLDQASETVLYAVTSNFGGEIYIRKSPSYRILDLANAVAPKCKIKIIGLREGEKIDEELISKNESQSVIDTNKYYIVVSHTDKKSYKFYYKNFKKVKNNFIYTSGTNDNFLTVKELEKIIRLEITNQN